MKTFDELIIVNYCYPDCIPLMNIMRLPQKEAYALASVFAESHPETTAFYRFADFENYYLLREKHPLSFVIEGSDYLRDWFGNGCKLFWNKRFLWMCEGRYLRKL